MWENRASTSRFSQPRFAFGPDTTRLLTAPETSDSEPTPFSVALDGVSLTVARLEDEVIGVAVIPHTYEETAFHTLKPAARINVECDMIAKHVERLLQLVEAPEGRRLSLAKLREEGF